MSGSQAFTWLLVIAGTVLLMRAFVPLVMLFMLLKLQFRYPRFQVLDESEVPASVRAYLLAGADQLRELGFEPRYWRRHTSLEVSEFGALDCLILDNAAGVSASVGTGQQGVGFRINFSAVFADGTRLETLHGESGLLIGPMPDVELVDSPDARTSALWQVFQERLAQLTQQRQLLRQQPLEAAAASERSVVRAIDSWLTQGLWQPAREPGRFELKLLAAGKYALHMARGNAQRARFYAERAKLDDGYVLEVEQIRCFRQLREMSERRSTRFGLIGTLLVSCVLFGLSMLRVVEPGTIISLLAVLLFHELGHYGAMVALGYRDTSIFFIPFFGAAARGLKRDATLHEQLLVLLAGPLPGLALAGALALFAPDLAHHPIGSEAINLLIVINLFNLLPIYPLDGGRMVELLFSGTRPFVEVAFRAFGALVMLGLGLFAHDFVLLALAGWLLLSIPAARRAANAVRRIRALGPLPEAEDGRLELLLSELRANQPSLAPTKRLAVIMPVAKRLQDGQLSRAGVLSWSGVYLISVLAGGVVVALSGGLGTAARDGKPQRGSVLACTDANMRKQLRPGTGTFMLHCAAPNAAEATTELKRFGDLPLSACLAAPWQAGVTLNPSEKRARASVAALQEHAQRATQAYMKAHPDTDELDDESTMTLEQHAEVEVRAEGLARVLTEARRAYVAAHEQDADFDAQTADLYLKYLAWSEAAAAPALPDTADTPEVKELIERLGSRDGTCDERERREYTVMVSTSDQNATVAGYRNDLRAGVHELASYLCAQSCQLRYHATRDR